MRIVGKEGEELPRDGVSEGEIEVRGPWVTGSYHNDPAPEKFRDGWLRTGDVGTLDERGFFTITDRIKDVIKSGGEWISSVELENALMAHPDVLEAAVIGVPDDKWGERPVAFVVARAGAGAPPTEETIRKHVAGFADQGTISKYAVPDRVHFVDAIPKTSVGKLDKKVIRARLAEQQTTAA
jgi:fatty-acyl-CoA synthase